MTGRLDSDSVIDEIVFKYASSRLERSVKKNARFAGEGFRAFSRRSDRAFEVKRDGVRVAMIHATSAYVPGREPIRANLLTAGPHWQRLADEVLGAEAELVAAWEAERQGRIPSQSAATAVDEAATEMQRFDDDPRRELQVSVGELPGQLTDAFLEASWKIRHQRQLAYERPIVLEYDYGELELFPIIRRGGVLSLTFRFDDGVDVVLGELLLLDRDPLPIVVPREIGNERALVA
jgi:hypothetical protein